MNLIGEDSETPLAFTELLSPAKIAELRDLVSAIDRCLLFQLSCAQSCGSCEDGPTDMCHLRPTDMCDLCRCMTTTASP